MRRTWLFWLSSTTAVLTLAIMTLYGCGGEGGPLSGDDGGNNGAPSAQFLALLPDDQDGATYVGSAKCGECHGTRHEGEEQIYNTWLETKHASVSVGCEQCHGPGSKHAAEPSDKNILTFPNSTSPIVCGQCHGTVYQEWLNSAHSKIVEAPVEESVQNPAQYGRSLRCIACHSGLFRTEIYEHGVDTATMTNEEIAEIAEETLSMPSVRHTAACATCHNPHAKTGNLTDDGEEVQLRHVVFNTDTSQIDPGSPATETTNFNHICAQCHNGRGANPADSSLANGTRPNMHDSPQFNMLMGIGGVEGSGPVLRNTAHANAPGQCSTCHMPSSRHTFTAGFEGCAPCHTIADAAARTATVKAEIQGSLYALRVRLEEWAAAQDFNNDGDPDGNGALWDYPALLNAEGITPPPQSLIPIEIKRARHNYYFVVRDGSYCPHNPPYARHLITVANEQLESLGGEFTSRARRNLSKSQIEAILRNDQRRASNLEMRKPE